MDRPCVVVINPHSIFLLEANPVIKGKMTLRSQRSLLEISRVTFVLERSFTVHFKAAYGGEIVTYVTGDPSACITAIREGLQRLEFRAGSKLHLLLLLLQLLPTYKVSCKGKSPWQ